MVSKETLKWASWYVAEWSKRESARLDALYKRRQRMVDEGAPDLWSILKSPRDSERE